MSARHGINHMAVGVGPQHLLHPLTGAESHVACCIEVAVPAAQNSLREFVTVMRFHHGKPIQKESYQWQSMLLGRLASEVTQSRFGEGKHDVRLETLHSFVQSFGGC